MGTQEIGTSSERISGCRSARLGVAMSGMVTEVRPPRRSEMTAYFRCLPCANGLPMWEPADAAWHGGPEPWPPQRAPASLERLEKLASAAVKDESFHPIATFVDGRCVGASATISFEVTVPGGGTVKMAGVTATGVIATHRRRGYLRQMMQAMFEAALERDEPLAMLSASEGGIHGRFGFSPRDLPHPVGAVPSRSGSPLRRARPRVAGTRRRSTGQRGLAPGARGRARTPRRRAEASARPLGRAVRRRRWHERTTAFRRHVGPPPPGGGKRRSGRRATVAHAPEVNPSP